MVKQGDIIKLDFNPQAGHEQAGYRPAVVLSNDFFNQKTNLLYRIILVLKMLSKKLIYNYE